MLALITEVCLQCEIMDSLMVIEKLGGPVAVARICEVAPQAVSQWKRSGIPKARLMFLKLARPDVFEKSGEDLGTSPGSEPTQEAA